jgi:hypothetical protein
MYCAFARSSGSISLSAKTEPSGAVMTTRWTSPSAGFDLLHLHRGFGKAGVEDEGGPVGERRLGLGRPQSCARVAGKGAGCARAGSRGREGIDLGVALADGEMDMGELGHSRQADLAERRPGADRIAFGDTDAAVLQVAVLRLPAVGVGDQHAVAALDVLDGVDAGLGDVAVGHAVPRRHHRSVGRGKDGDAGFHGAERRHPDVDPVVAVIGLVGAHVVATVAARVAVDIVLHDAVRPDRALDRKGQFDGGGRRSRCEQEEGGQYEAHSGLLLHLLQASVSSR